MPDRMLGSDATLWHMERPESPLHTLKTVIVDSSRLGRPLTRTDLMRSLEPRLGLLPRSTQRVLSVAGFPGRPFWIEDPNFDLASHVDELTAPAPGDRRAMDTVHARLAESHLDLGRPLWSATLVHGLEGGRQAIVVRVHHAVTDGIGALNTFLLLTADTPEAHIPIRARASAEFPTRRFLYRRLVRDAIRLAKAAGPLLAAARRSSSSARRFRRAHADLPPAIGRSRNFTNRSGQAGRRECASCEMDLAVVKAVSKAAGVTVNGVYHALVAAALRDELIKQGDDITAPAVAAFGIAVRSAPGDRVTGNYVTPTNVNIYSNLDDPIQRLSETARSCREGVELRQVTGLEMAGRWSEFTCRMAPWLLRLCADRSPRVVNHVTTANVVGPASNRFAGPVEIVDWISFAVAFHPANINVTAYSYSGRLSIGLVATTGVLPDPPLFLQRMREELSALEKRLCTADGSAPPSKRANR